MGFISLDDLQPTQISKDLKDKFILLYGKPKAGKTSMAVQFPKNFLMATEIGFHDIPNAMVGKIESWSDFKKYLRELALDKNKVRFDSITIDTVTLLWDLCAKHIASQNNVESIADMPYGRGYDKTEKEFDDGLRKITLLGYGLILIAHSEIRIEKLGDTETEFIAPSLNKRPFRIVNQIVDIIGYIKIDFDKDGNETRNIYTRQTPTIMAGSRFKYLDPIIPLDYNSLVTSLVKALEKRATEAGMVPMNDSQNAGESKKRPFDAAMIEAKELFLSLVEDEAKLILINKSIKEWFGNELFRLSETQPAQQELLENVITDMKAIT